MTSAQSALMNPNLVWLLIAIVCFALVLALALWPTGEEDEPPKRLPVPDGPPAARPITRPITLRGALGAWRHLAGQLGMRFRGEGGGWSMNGVTQGMYVVVALTPEPRRAGQEVQHATIRVTLTPEADGAMPDTRQLVWRPEGDAGRYTLRCGWLVVEGVHVYAPPKAAKEHDAKAPGPDRSGALLHALCVALAPGVEQSPGAGHVLEVAPAPDHLTVRWRVALEELEAPAPDANYWHESLPTRHALHTLQWLDLLGRAGATPEGAARSLFLARDVPNTLRVEVLRAVCAHDDAHPLLDDLAAHLRERPDAARVAAWFEALPDRHEALGLDTPTLGRLLREANDAARGEGCDSVYPALLRLARAALGPEAVWSRDLALFIRQDLLRDLWRETSPADPAPRVVLLEGLAAHLTESREQLVLWALISMERDGPDALRALPEETRSRPEDALLRIVEDGPRRDQERALRLLANLGGPRALATLREALAQDAWHDHQLITLAREACATLERT